MRPPMTNAGSNHKFDRLANPLAQAVRALTAPWNGRSIEDQDQIAAGGDGERAENVPTPGEDAGTLAQAAPFTATEIAEAQAAADRAAEYAEQAAEYAKQASQAAALRPGAGRRVGHQQR
ncbi:MAG TPA: hypothetical protein VKG45_00825 [Actinomycetes bacterium]|nr:hypothetical protein [Actinomycetes bacterium]